MTLAEKLIKEFEQLTEERQKEVIDFVEFVKAKEQREIENLMDSVRAHQYGSNLTGESP